MPNPVMAMDESQIQNYVGPRRENIIRYRLSIQESVGIEFLPPKSLMPNTSAPNTSVNDKAEDDARSIIFSDDESVLADDEAPRGEIGPPAGGGST